MPKKYVVRLTPEERERLQDLVSKGKTQAYRIRHAHVLLKADAEGPAGWIGRSRRPFRAIGLRLRASGSVLCWRDWIRPLSERSEPILPRKESLMVLRKPD